MDRLPIVDGNGRPYFGDDGKPLYCEDVAPEDLDLSAEQEFQTKCRMLAEYCERELTQCDFLEEVFWRFGDCPWEEPDCDDYQIWREQTKQGAEQIDYSGCSDRRKWNAIVLYRSMRKKPKKSGVAKGDYDQCDTKLLLREDWDKLDWLQSRYFGLMAPITYKGKRPTVGNAKMLYAFAIDLDGVGVDQLCELFRLMGNTWSSEPMQGQPIIPPPNIIVNSGHGLHLYYLLEHPIPLGKYHEHNARLLDMVSEQLYKMVTVPARPKIGEPGTSKDEVATPLGIYHQFRIPGTLTKPLRYNKRELRTTGQGLPIRAWSLGQPYYSLSYWVQRYSWVPGWRKTFTPDVVVRLERGDRLLDPKHKTLKQALKAYPNWDPTTPKGSYIMSRRVYDWWLGKLMVGEEVKEGHRFYCIKALVAFAAKCGVPYDELSRDAYGLVAHFDDLTRTPGNRFRRSDVNEALKFWHYKNVKRYSRIKIEKSTGIPLPKTKRNRRRQERHLDNIRKICNDDHPNGSWRDGNGRKSQAQTVALWRSEHPGCNNKSQCARDTGLSRPTVTKWWEVADRL